MPKVGVARIDFHYLRRQFLRSQDKAALAALWADYNQLKRETDELLLYIAEMAEVNLGIVGGHEATRREVIEELTMQYGLRRWVEVPPTWESSLTKAVLKAKLERCDLIVIITGYMNHSLTHAVFGLRALGAIRGEVAMLNFRGKSGVLREVLRHVALLK